MVYRSASALGSCLPSITGARAKVAGAGAILRPVSNSTQVVMRRAQSVAQAAWSHPAFHLSPWSCMGARHRVKAAYSTPQEDRKSMEISTTTRETDEPLLLPHETTTIVETVELPASTSEGMAWISKLEYSCSDEMRQLTDVDVGEDLMDHGSHEDGMNEIELWQTLEQELHIRTEGDEADVVAEIREAEEAAVNKVDEIPPESSVSEMKEAQRFFPPGKIMHIVTLLPEQIEREDGTVANSEDKTNGQPVGAKVRIFLTSRSLYSKLRLSQTMISDHFMPDIRVSQTPNLEA